MKLNKLIAFTSFGKLIFLSVLGRVRFWCWDLGRRQERQFENPWANVWKLLLIHQDGKARAMKLGTGKNVSGRNNDVRICLDQQQKESGNLIV